MKSKVKLNVIIEDDDWQESVDFDAIKIAEEVKDLTFDYIESEVSKGKHELLSLKKTFLLNVCLSNNEAVHKLNKEFRGMDKPTNVLSFANIDDEEFWDTLADGDEIELGDIILAFETLRAEADVKKISLYAHYCHLLVHGFLHILGYDHQDDKDAEEMEGLETEILEAFMIDDPYKESKED